KIEVAIDICQMINPKSSAIFIDGWEKLDSENRDKFFETALTRDLQLIATEVKDTKKPKLIKEENLHKLPNNEE
ncbi:unnamed protein product, partial [marine sediment metagenome]